MRLAEPCAAHPSASCFIARLRAAIDAFRLDELAGLIATARREVASVPAAAEGHAGAVLIVLP
nr:hypothetical protein [uncultured Rhodopila sp.]